MRMKKGCFIFPLLLWAILFTSWKALDNNWLTEKHKGYTLTYTAADKKDKKEYQKFIAAGIQYVKRFFNASYNQQFNVVLHPGRHSLDSTWQKDWNMPNFKSECWMVASGVAARLDIIAPKLWDKEACEHRYADTKKTQQLIIHELVHVYHGQLNSSPDFSDTEGIDWFVEGLATFASGQCDSARIREIKKAISNNNIPKTLDKFWSGNLKYGLSGSVVLYIDYKYGRTKLKALLPLNKKSAILDTLGITEAVLLHDWKLFIENA